ncbi:hypothetical protein J6TS2_50990 [Heyndrickxia sporothermodurans]|nr:hypothetical protein J6TS2_50990 [Heyndrickxia sporothermodurans]
MKWSIDLTIILIFIVNVLLSFISAFASSETSEVIRWIMIVGWLSFFIWITPKSEGKKKNRKNKEG